MSLITGAVMVFVIARTSNQARIVATKRAIQAALFEIRLFGDDPAAVLRSFGDVLRLNARYLGLSLVPLAWVAIPLAFVIPQLDAFYGYSGLVAGEPAIVSIERAGSSDGALTLIAPPEVRVDTDAVTLAGANEVVWRIVPAETGEFIMTVQDGDRRIDKAIAVSERAVRRSPRRLQGGIVSQLE